MVRKGHGEPHLRYKDHRAVEDAHGVITATITTSGDGKENGQMMPLVDQHEHNTGMRVETAVADSQYGTVENFRACGQRGIRSHMADLATTQKGTGRRKGIFEASHFVYDPATDTYRCPAGRTSKRRRHRKARRASEQPRLQAIALATIVEATDPRLPHRGGPENPDPASPRAAARVGHTGHCS